jgi:hypothetical protein
MGRLKIWNDAGVNDDLSTVTSYSDQSGRISDFIEELREITEGASESLNSFKEVEDEIGEQAYQDFLVALNGG